MSFFYCFATCGRRLDALVAEVTNIPWRERHAYVLDLRPSRRASPSPCRSVPKVFHVSPFMGMNQDYRFALRPPRPDLALRITNLEAGAPLFDATLVLRRREIGGPASPGRSCAIPG